MNTEGLKPKIVLVGAAGQQGLEYYNLLKNAFLFMAAVDSNFESLKDFYKNESIPLFRDVDEAIKKVDFNIAIVCVPHHLHRGVALSLLKNKKFVIKEKPLALNKVELQSYKELPNQRLVTIIQRPFNPVFLRAKNELETIGNIYSYSYKYSLRIPELTKGWRASRACAGGGVLIDMGYHILDIILSFFGTPTRITGEMSYCYNAMKKEGLEDSISMLLNHSNLVQGSLSLNRHHSSKKEEFEIIGNQGTLLITPKEYKVFNRKGDLYKSFSLESDPKKIKLYMFKEYIQHWQDSDYIQKHFNHHASIVYLIDDFYKINHKQTA